MIFNLFTCRLHKLLPFVLLVGLSVPGFAQNSHPTPAGIFIPAADSLIDTELKEIRIEKPGNIAYPALFKPWEPQTLEHIDNFALNRRDYVLRMYEKGQKFFPGIEKIFSQYNLPTELKVLIVLESAFRPHAVSVAGAVGYWQMMDATAAEYGLAYISNEERQEAAGGKKAKAGKKVTVGKQKNTSVATKPADAAKKAGKKRKKTDERSNLRKSTLAAARYLRDRFRNLNNDLLLVVASYNYGIGNVWETMKESGVENPTFWDIKDLLPAETRSYVMNFITLNVLFNNYERLKEKTLSCKTHTVKGLAWVVSSAVTRN